MAEAVSPHQVVLPELRAILQPFHVHRGKGQLEAVVNLPAHLLCGQGAQQAFQKFRAPGLREIPLFQGADEALCQGTGHHKPLGSCVESVEQASVLLYLFPLGHGEQGLHPLFDLRGFLVDGFLVVVLVVIDNPGADTVYFRDLLFQAVLTEEQLLYLGELDKHLLLQGPIQASGAAAVQLPEREFLVQEFQHTVRQALVFQPLDVELYHAFAAALVVCPSQPFSIALVEVVHLPEAQDVLPGLLVRLCQLSFLPHFL